MTNNIRKYFVLYFIFGIGIAGCKFEEKATRRTPGSPNTTSNARPAPILSAITPSVGFVAGGLLLRLTGQNFQEGAKVLLGISECLNASVVSATELTCTTPPHTVGKKNVFVINPDDKSVTLVNGFTYEYPAPTLATVNPAIGLTPGGTLVTLTGTGFLTGATVLIGGAACTSVTVVSATQITCLIPPNTVGAKNIVIMNLDNKSVTLNNGLTYENPAPTLATVNPAIGLTPGSTLVTLTGTGFLTGATVLIGGAACTSVTVVSATQITCLIPPNTVGAKNIVIMNLDNKSVTLNNGLTYENPPPTITHISPNTGFTTGGTSITLTGTGILVGATVSLGGLACNNVVVASAMQITCETPTAPAGTVNVTLTNTDNKTAIVVNGFTYLIPPPAVTEVNPQIGSFRGGFQMTVSGTGFLPGAVVMVGSKACNSVTVVSPTQITCTVQANDIAVVPITVTNTDNQTNTLNNAFSFTSFVYVLNNGSENISGYSINSITGNLVPVTGSPFSVGMNPTSLAISSNGRVFTANNNSSSISGFNINLGTGLLLSLLGYPFTVRGGVPPVALAFDPLANFLYQTGGISNVKAYTVTGTDSTLAEIAGSPFSTASLSLSLLVHPIYSRLYVVNNTASSVRDFQINGSGSLTVVGNDVATGSSPVWATIHPQGNFLYVANSFSSSISAFTAPPLTEVLTPIAGASTGSSPKHLVIDPSGKFLYSSNSGSDNISAFTINQTTGVLTPITGSPFAAGDGCNAAAIDPTGRFLYTANNNAGTVSAFSINPTTGALTALVTSPFNAGTRPRIISIDMPLPPPPPIVDFEIGKVGVNGAWNTAATALIVPVGSRIRITNKDTVNHLLHAPPSTVCLHSSTPLMPETSMVCYGTIPPGFNSDDRNGGSIFYDHNGGTAATFFVKAAP